ncbi:MAG: hypothetical protein LC104_08395 [Bacteroidales bacterium]|nr:hypothetical protein [Bacteroidales bacterium]
MFVPVSCHHCGKPFQVPEATIGKAAICPWCQELVSTQAQALAEPASAAPVVDSGISAGRSRQRFWWRFVLLGLVCGVVAVGTFAVARLGSGQVPASAWQKFVPPDGSCAVQLPGTPDAEVIGTNPFSPMMLTGERYRVHRWFDGVTVSVGWVNLDAERVRLARPEDIIAAEQRRLKETLGGQVEAEASLKFNQHTGTELLFRTGNGPVIVRLIVVRDRPQPRLFILSVAGKNITLDGPVPRRFFGSFTLIPMASRQSGEREPSRP